MKCIARFFTVLIASLTVAALAVVGLANATDTSTCTSCQESDRQASTTSDLCQMNPTQCSNASAGTGSNDSAQRRMLSTFVHLTVMGSQLQQEDLNVVLAQTQLPSNCTIGITFTRSETFEALGIMACGATIMSMESLLPSEVQNNLSDPRAQDRENALLLVSKLVAQIKKE